MCAPPVAYVDGRVVGKAVGVAGNLRNASLMTVQNNGIFRMELDRPLPAGTQITFVQVLKDKVSERNEINVLPSDSDDAIVDAPTLNDIYSDDLVITGTGKPGYRVIVRVGREEIGSAEVDENGKYAIHLSSPLDAGSVVEAFQLDVDGNQSTAIRTIVKLAGQVPGGNGNGDGTGNVSGGEGDSSGSGGNPSTHPGTSEKPWSNGGGSAGQVLPKTAGMTAPIGFAGGGLMLAGLAGRLLGRKRKKDEKN